METIDKFIDDVISYGTGFIIYVSLFCLYDVVMLDNDDEHIMTFPGLL